MTTKNEQPTFRNRPEGIEVKSITPIDWPGLESESLAMVRAAAPHEMANANLYLCDARRMTSGNITPEVFYGITGPDYDLVLRPFIDWHGRGAGVLYPAKAIEENGSFDPAAVRILFLELMAHEWSHVLREGYLNELMTPKIIDPNMIQVTRELAIDAIKQKVRPVNIGRAAMIAADLELRHHDAAWVRTCCHVKHRLEERLGLLLPLSGILLRRYGPNGSRYGWALREEVQRCQHWPISEILATPPPDEFNELWESAMQDRREQATREMNQQPRQPDIVASGMVSQPTFSEPDAIQEEVIMSSLSTFFNSVGEAFSKRKRTVAESYAELVRDVANGKTPKAEDAERILDAAHKTPADLQAAVERILHRRQLRKIVDSASSVPKEREQLAEKASVAEHKKQRADEEYENVLWPIAVRERELTAIVNASDGAKKELERAAGDAVKQAVIDAQQIRGKIGEQLWEAQRDLAAAQEIRKGFLPSVQMAAARYSENQIIGPLDAWQRENFPSLEQFNEARRKVAGADGDIVRLTAAIAELEALIPAADAVVEKARLALLEP